MVPVDMRGVGQDFEDVGLPSLKPEPNKLVVPPPRIPASPYRVPREWAIGKDPRTTVISGASFPAGPRQVEM